MTTSDGHKSYVYVGLAGETAPGREVKSGLYRMADGDDGWELLTNGLPQAHAIRALAVHPQKPEIVYAGTQDGPYRSTDHGDHWEKVSVPDHGQPVWSLLFHPNDSSVMYAGYESCGIYRSEDGGERWSPLPVSVRFPEITMATGANPAKRVLMMSASTANPDEIYGAIEVGGLIRTLDGGESWENMSHGLYTNDDLVDMHGVLASTLTPGTVISISRAGMFRSTDQGDHWSHVDLETLNAKGQTYCRGIKEVPGNPRYVWVAAGAGFQSDLGVLYRSKDGGVNWERVDTGFEAKSTMFGIAFDERQPKTMYCATNGGQVFGSHDGGENWSDHPLPEGATQVYALACG
ncbi:MAG: hypothetical protein IIC96_06300 [Chloroflexi bacterium]|nr:hypothetical protein [Chloroflexota bacterium]